MRVISGKLTGDASLISVNHDSKERVGQLYVLQGKARDQVAEAFAGDIVAVAKLKTTKTGDTLADERSLFAMPKPVIPAPLITYALQPRPRATRTRLPSS